VISKPTFILTLEALGDESRYGTVPAIVRMRRALKVLLRGFGLKCLTISEIQPSNVTSPENREWKS
jgi:hypothetical protein